MIREFELREAARTRMTSQGLVDHVDVEQLRKVFTLRLSTKDPFRFQYTFWKPSHFPTGLEKHGEGVSWRTFRFKEVLCGVRFEMDRLQVKASVFASERGTKQLRDRLVSRIEAAYGLQEDIVPFLAQASRALALSEPIRILAGMRMSCPESLFEIAVISLLLQNTTVRRTTQMMESLLERYGRRVRFDSQELWCFFSPIDILGVSEEELRLECRLGYRAKYLPAFAQFFCNRDDDALRKDEHVLKALQEIRGVGPYTAAVIASHALRDPNAASLDVWNTRIVARHLLGNEEATKAEVRSGLETIAPGFAGLTLMYLVEYEFLHLHLHPEAPSSRMPSGSSI